MDQQAVTEVSSEEKELQEIREKWYNAPKLGKWFDLYFDASNKETFHNQTAAALIAYELDSANPHDRKTAFEMGSRNARKVKIFAQKLLEEKGWTKEKVIELIAAKAVSSNNSKFVLMLAELTEVYEDKPRNLSQTNVNLNNSTSVNALIQIPPEEEKQLSRDFADFLDAKYRGKPAMNPDAPSQS